MIKQYLWNVLIAIDQGANVALGPVLNAALKPDSNHFGDPDETLSSVMGKNISAGDCKGCKAICKVLNFFQTNHCKKSIETDEGKNSV